jgi:hypothetical protein
MLPAMSLVSQWRQIEAGLPEEWRQARIGLAIADVTRLDRAAALLGPLAPGRSGTELNVTVDRRGWPGAEAVRRLLGRLDGEGLGGTLVLREVLEEPAADGRSEEASARQRLAGAWDGLVSTLPEDWSDLLCHLELASSDDLPPAALLLAPLNPARERAATPGFRFRVARSFGYGAAPEMARRCLARLDDAGIPGRLQLLRALSDTRPVFTQGPVWYVGGKPV